MSSLKQHVPVYEEKAALTCEKMVARVASWFAMVLCSAILRRAGLARIRRRPVLISSS